MEVLLNTRNLDDYRLFLRIKALPQYSFSGHVAEFPDEYAPAVIGEGRKAPAAGTRYGPLPGLFDYQRDIAALAIRKRKFAVFAEPGLGKTLILLEFARHVRRILKRRRVLIVCPLMVVRQTLAEADRFYGKLLPLERVPSGKVGAWLAGEQMPGGVIGAAGITNMEAMTDDLPAGNLGALIVDDFSPLKSHYGSWAQNVIRLGRGLEWKLSLTGTPAPNDRIEYANQAVFLDAFPTVNSFLARYFVNRGQTDNRWEIKPHALRPFYRALSHWCIFLTNPATYGWKDNVGTIPPIHVHIHGVPLTDAQRELVPKVGGDLFGTPGGITSRAKIAQLAKGRHEGSDVDTAKPEFIRQLVESWPEESTIVWCLYNREQDTLERVFPGAASIRGDTPHEERERLIDDFKAGRRRVLISKPRVLGFGLNLQVATRQVFSSCQDSYESYFQAVKRSNRVGSTRPLNVHLPVTDLERPMMENVLRKAHRVEADTAEQERLFKEYALAL